MINIIYAAFLSVSLYSLYIYLHVHVSVISLLCTTDDRDKDSWARQFGIKLFWDCTYL